MSSNTIIKRVSIDANALAKNMCVYLEDVMSKAEDKMMDTMSEFAEASLVGDGPGTPDWRDWVASSITLVSSGYKDGVLESVVGIPPNKVPDNSPLLARAMIVESGAGSAVGNPPIATKPGAVVWNDDLSGKTRSTAEKSYNLPDGFNQTGNHFVENSVKEFSKRFSDIFSDAMHNVPDWVYGNAVSSR